MKRITRVKEEREIPFEPDDASKLILSEEDAEIVTDFKTLEESIAFMYEIAGSAFKKKDAQENN
jgi:hypothetical protein